MIEKVAVYEMGGKDVLWQVEVVSRSGGQRNSKRGLALAMRKGSRAHVRDNSYTDELILFNTTFRLVFTPTDTSKFSQSRIQAVSNRPHGVQPLSVTKLL